MKLWLVATVAVAISLYSLPHADAKRLGGGKSVGMQRSAPPQAAPQSPPPKQAAPAQAAPQQGAAPQQAAPAAAPTAAATQAAAAPAKRSWLGPIAGLAAGLGLAALMSHLGLGEAFANFLMLALLAVAAVFLVVFLMRRFGGGAGSRQPALASAGSAPSALQRESAAAEADSARPAVVERTAWSAPAAGSEVSVTGRPLPSLGDAAVVADRETAPLEMPASVAVQSEALKLPEGFDLPAFERVAKMIFIRLQAANDARDLDDLRQFTTPEMFASLRLDLQERGEGAQRTDVERVQARVVDFALESGRQIVSVRFEGLIREDATGPATAFDEVWHLVRPEGGEGTWAIAGIQQSN